MCSSGDDNFDVDDEIFLQAAVNIERTFVESRQYEHAGGSSSKIHTETSNFSEDRQTQNSLRGSKISKDPLGLNKTLLNRGPFQTKPSTKCDLNFHAVSRTKVDAQTTSECENKVLNKGNVKKFNFKSPAGTVGFVDGNNQVTSVREIPGGSCERLSEISHQNASGYAATTTNTSGAFRQSSAQNEVGSELNPTSPTCDVYQSLEHVGDRNAGSFGLLSRVSKPRGTKGAGTTGSVPDAVRILFQVGDDWDSDLDLSGMDCDGSPTWVPGTGQAPEKTESRFTGGISMLSTDSCNIDSSELTVSASTISAVISTDSRVNTGNPSGCYSPIDSSTLCTLLPTNVPTPLKSLEGTGAKSELQHCFKTPNSTRLCRSADFTGSKTPNDSIRSVGSCLKSPSLSSATRNSKPLPDKPLSLSTASTSAHGFQLRRPNLPGVHPRSSQGCPPIQHNTQFLAAPAQPISSTSTSQTPQPPESPVSGGGLSVLETWSSSKPSLRSSTPQTPRPPESPASEGGLSVLETPSSSKPSLSSSTSRRKRKFPGPAGVLPKLKPGLSLEDMNAFKPASPRVTNITKPQAVPDSQVASTQGGEDRWTEGPWSLMVQDLEPQAQSILQDYSIGTILSKAMKRQLPRSKVPVLCASLDQVSIQNAEASVLLRDPTGVMKGTVHRHVVKEYPDDMQTGTVLVLRQVGVFSPSGRNYYLNITPNNLVRIYSRCPSSQGVCTRTVAAFSEDDFRVPDPVPDSSTTHGLGPSPVATTSRMPLRSPLLHTGVSTTPFRGHPPASSPGFQFQHRPMRPYSTGMTPSNVPFRHSNTIVGPPVQNRPPQNPGVSSTHAGVRMPQSGNSNSSRFTFHQASPRIGALAPPDIQGPKVTSARQITLDSVSHVGNNNPGTSQQLNQCMDNLWQDDQLDELLSDMGDEMLSECG